MAACNSDTSCICPLHLRRTINLSSNGYLALVRNDQVRRKFLIECAQKMRGKSFVLEPLLSEDGYFKIALNSVDEARSHFQPVPMKTVLAETYKFKKDLAVAQRERHEEQEEMETLISSTLNRAGTLEEENIALKQGLSDANERADELERSCSCAICLSQKVGVVFMPCQHACCCTTCWKTWSEKYGSFAPCPLCRKPTVASMEMKW